MSDEPKSATAPAGVMRAKEIAGSISREALGNLPIRRYEGEIALVTNRHEAEKAWTDLRQEHVVGFDTETRPSFTKGQVHLPCLVQVATARCAYLFRLRNREVFPVLAHLLEGPHIVKAGVALAYDLRSLKLVFPFAQKNVLDLSVVARRCGMTQTGLRNLAGLFLGFRIPKGASTSNWAAAHLTPAQLNYAALDAWACRELYLRFLDLALLAHHTSRSRTSDH